MWDVEYLPLIVIIGKAEREPGSQPAGERNLPFVGSLPQCL